MKLSRIQPHQDIREKVRAVFSDFSKTHPANKWRRKSGYERERL